MKRTVWVLTGILAFSSIVFGACLLLLAIGWPVTPERFQVLAVEARRMPAVLILIFTALICMAIGIVILYGMIWNRMNRRTNVLLEKTALGETAVSFTALNEIVERTLKNRKDVKNGKVKVHAIGSSIRIEVHAVTAPTVSLYEITHSLQDEIHAAIQSICGVSIGTIDVTVDQAELLPNRT
jgi:uncharacterized alkaline shock family protein YloU